MGVAKFYKEEEIMNTPGLREQPTSKIGGGCSALDTPPAVEPGCPTGPMLLLGRPHRDAVVLHVGPTESQVIAKEQTH